MPVLYIHPGPQPNLDQIAFVREQLPARGPAWARGYMAKTGGVTAYPADLRRAVGEVALVTPGMYVLTVRQPWAWAIFHGKDVENRDWDRPYQQRIGLDRMIGQRIAIHAAAGCTRAEYDAAALVIRHIGTTAPLPAFEDLVRSAILGTVLLRAATEESVSPWFVGPLGLVLRQSQLLPAPIPARGALGFWRYQPGKGATA